MKCMFCGCFMVYKGLEGTGATQVYVCYNCNTKASIPKNGAVFWERQGVYYANFPRGVERCEHVTFVAASAASGRQSRWTAERIIFVSNAKGG